MRKRKRCPFCRCLYAPDARVAKRQWSCTKARCQAERRRETQRRYRRTRPDDGAARRLRAQIAAAKAGEKPPAPRAPPVPIVRFPWEELRDEISPQGFVITLFFVRLLVGVARDEIRAQAVEIEAKFGRLRKLGRQDETAAPAAAG